MTLTERLLEVANIGAEWVLWVLIVLSVLSIATIVERVFFFATHRASVGDLQVKLIKALNRGDGEKLAAELRATHTMEAQVLAAGLEQQQLGPTSVGELMMGALSAQKQRYERFLAFLATMGSNTPFIGLFGTVLGIIQAFSVFDIKNPASSQGIMSAISEALIATGVGLLVAIPAVIAFNIFKTQVKKSVSNTDQLVRTLLAFLSADIDSDGERAKIKPPGERSAKPTDASASAASAARTTSEQVAS
jgi:biopolymer transport protein ExbB/TolQ